GSLVDVLGVGPHRGHGDRAVWAEFEFRGGDGRPHLTWHRELRRLCGGLVAIAVRPGDTNEASRSGGESDTPGWHPASHHHRLGALIDEQWPSLGVEEVESCGTGGDACRAAVIAHLVAHDAAGRGVNGRPF